MWRPPVICGCICTYVLCAAVDLSGALGLVSGGYVGVGGRGGSTNVIIVCDCVFNVRVMCVLVPKVTVYMSVGRVLCVVLCVVLLLCVVFASTVTVDTVIVSTSPAMARDELRQQ